MYEAERYMTMREWDERKLYDTVFDFDTFTLASAWSPIEKRFLGYTLIPTTTPGPILAFLHFSDIEVYLRRAPEHILGRVQGSIWGENPFVPVTAQLPPIEGACSSGTIPKPPTKSA